MRTYLYAMYLLYAQPVWFIHSSSHGCITSNLNLRSTALKLFPNLWLYTHCHGITPGLGCITINLLRSEGLDLICCAGYNLLPNTCKILAALARFDTNHSSWLYNK